MTIGVSASLFINKLGAAERQLNSAIRMVLAEEDDLAVHTVAAAAHRLLRDIKESWGRDAAVDLYTHALLGYAEDVVAGKSLPTNVIIVPWLVRLIDQIADRIRSGGGSAVPELANQLGISSSNAHWQKFNSTANFLKHADKDVDGLHPLDSLAERNLELVSMACAAFIDTLGRSTPQIEAFMIFAHGATDGFVTPFWSGAYAEQFRKAPPRRRRQACQRILKVLKKNGEHGVVL